MNKKYLCLNRTCFNYCSYRARGQSHTRVSKNYLHIICQCQKIQQLWPSTLENMATVFLLKQGSNQAVQLQTLLCVLLLLQICFCFVMRETLCCLCQTIIKLILLKLLTAPSDIDDLLNIDNPYFERMVGQIYPTELQLNKANSSDTEDPFLDLNLSITNGIVSSKIYDKRNDLNFEIVNFPFLDGDVPHSPSNGVYISQLIRFARVCSNVDDFNNRNLFLTAKLLKQGYRYHKIRKAFSTF